MGNSKGKSKAGLGLIGILVTLVGGACWGGSSTCGQWLMQTAGVNVGWLVNIRLLIGGTIILLIVIFKERSIKSIFVIWKDWKTALHVILFAVVGFYLTQYTYYYTASISNSATATAIEYLSPMFVMIYVSIRRKAFPSIYKIICLVLAISGVFMMATHGSFSSLAISLEALIWGIFSAVALAGNNVIPVTLMDKYGTMLTTGWGMFIGAIIMLPFYRPWQYHYTWTRTFFFCFLVSVLVGTVFSYLMFLEGVHLIGPEKASMLACIEPISATFFTVTFLNTVLVGMDYLGIASILTSVILLSVFEVREKKAIQT